MTLDDRSCKFDNWENWAPYGAIAHWTYDGHTVYELSGGSLPEGYFVVFPWGGGRTCTVILMTADWPAHRND